MHLQRILPTPAQLAASAVANTAFVAEITIGASITTCSELCAELAAEAWETERNAIVGATIPWQTTAATARILADQGAALRHLNVEALYAADARIEKALATLASVRRTLADPLPLTDAAAETDGIDDELGGVVAKLKRASMVLGIEIDRAEVAISQRLREGLN
jgi:uridylate kinase